MTALPPDVVTEISNLVAELQQRLESSLAAHDATIALQTATARENARLRSELATARDREAASDEILRTIAKAPGNADLALQKIAETSARLFAAPSASILLAENGEWTQSFRFGDSANRVVAALPMDAIRVGGPNLPGMVIADNCQIHVPDLDHLDAAMAHWPGLPFARAAGTRTMCGTPLRRGDEAIGVLIVYRDRLAPFTADELAVQQRFADQAVIAIENAWLLNEVEARTRDLTEALTYQTGSSNILSVIASSPTEVGPVLKAIVDNACEVCDAYDAAVLLKDGDDLRFSAHHGPIPIDLEKWPINRHWTAGRAVLNKQPVHLHDLLAEENADFSDGRELSRRMGHRSILSVPLLRQNESIGAIVLRRTEVHPFSDRQIELLQTFADQAVIAIGNVRLFDEVQAKTRDLTEALQQQTATADVLKVISRSAFDLQTVLDTLVTSASTLCDANQGMLMLFEDGILKPLSYFGPYPDKFEFIKSLAAPPHRGIISGRAVLDGHTAHVADILIDPEFTNNSWQELTGFRAMLAVPLMRQAQPIGAMALSRTTPGPFADRQIELVQTFADQAVIAIENVRLFDEVQARTSELAASLDDLRTAQDRLVQTEKLASLGQLTAGIAHEIKNPLNFVNNFSALSAELTDELNDLLKSAALSEKMQEEVDELTGLLKDNLQKVVQHGKRADSIVKNMLLHSREGSGDHGAADINALVDESLNLAYHGARAEKPDFNVTLQRDLDPDAGMIEVFPQEITRVFLNLISNGLYAVAKRKSEADDPGFDPILKATTKNLGDTVEIRIRDNGTGIPAEVKDKMFNPFFTTKPAGEGTGLGLSMSHDIIVKQHGGAIDVETVPGQFTEFRIVLPRRSRPSDKAKDRA